jgi:hypothetical protein
MIANIIKYGVFGILAMKAASNVASYAHQEHEHRVAQDPELPWVDANNVDPEEMIEIPLSMYHEIMQVMDTIEEKIDTQGEENQ